MTDEVQAIVDSELLVLLRRCVARPQTIEEKALGSFVSTYTAPKSDMGALAHLKDLLNSVGCMNTRDDVCVALGKSLYSKTCTLFSVYDGPEEKHTNHWRFHISNGTLFLPDLAYYKGSVVGGKHHYISYKSALEATGILLGYAGLGEFADYEAEYAVHIESGYDDDTKVYTGKELENAYSAINWSALWGAYGLDDAEWKHMRFVVDAPSWLRHVNHMMRTYTVDQWRTLFRAVHIVCFFSLLPAKYRKELEDVNEALYGLHDSEMGGDMRLLGLVKQAMALELSRAYKRVVESPTFRNEIRKFVESIQRSAMRRIADLTWMKSATKSTAIEKLQKLHLGVLYPVQAFDYVSPKLGENSLENIIETGRANSKMSLRRVRKKLTSQIWDNPVFMVNAFYLATGNRFVLPAAIVREPFYSRNNSIGANYGALGCVIGHEIIHAFDENGKEYDAHGNLRNWWTPTDNRTFNRQTRALEKLYNKDRLLGRHIDGSQTLSENIADLGGMAIALDALKVQLELQKASTDVRKRELREFFVAYATSWREKARREKQQVNLVVDVHSPAKYRVNNIVRHFQEWYDAFDVRESDDLYLDPRERITIF